MGFLDNFLIKDEFQKIVNRFPSNPLVQYVATNNRTMFFRELSHLSYWLSLIPRNSLNLKNHIDSLYKNKDEYLHNRLGLMIAARILNSNQDLQIDFDPKISNNRNSDLKITNSKLTNSNSLFIELTGRYEFKIVKEILKLCNEIHKFAKKRSILLQIRIELHNLSAQSSEILKLKTLFFDQFKKNNFHIEIKSNNCSISLIPSNESINEFIFPSFKRGLHSDKEIMAKYISNKLKKKKLQLPSDKPSLIIMDVSNIGILKSNFILYDVIDENFLIKIIEQVYSRNSPNLIGVMLFDISSSMESSDFNFVYSQPNSSCTIEVFEKNCNSYLDYLAMILQGEINIPFVKVNKINPEETFNELREIDIPIHYDQKTIIQTILLQK